MLIFCTLFFDISPVYSEEVASSGYKILDPVMDAGGYGSSTSFGLSGVISQVSNGTSTSLSFGDNAGFLYFPAVTTLSISSVTPGDSQVTLFWTSATGYLGWTVSGYNIGKATTSGGPYIYTLADSLISSIVTDLTNSTTYYFVVAAKDFFGNAIATSTEVSATPVAGVTPPPPSGGGGGGGSTTITAGAIFSGRAYPRSTITLLKDAQVVSSTVADANANFQITVSGLSGRNYIFSLYSEDFKGLQSPLYSFPVSITSGVTTKVGNIFIAPTITVDKSEVKRGDNIAIFGQSVPAAEIIISVNSDEELFVKKTTDLNGIYLLNFDSSVLELGQHYTRVKAALKEEISSLSKAVGFTVGTKNVFAKLPTQSAMKADLNNDKQINYVDFSIAAYWYKRTLSATFKLIEAERLNGDGKIDPVDFSIMAYYWTG